MTAPLRGREIVLGVTGSIAAYRAAEVLRRLQDAGAGVTAVLTPGAEKFITPVTFQALTGRPVATDPFDVEDGRMPHLTLGKGADAVLIAPCTAQTLSGLAAGDAGGLLGAIVLTTRAPVFLAPAMHEPMWTHPATRRNVKICESYGYRILGPARGALASGDSGLGRLEEPARIVDALVRALRR